MTAPLLIDENGTGWIPEGDTAVGMHVYTGSRLASWPSPETGSAVLLIKGGVIDDPAFETDAVMFAITGSSLDALIGDLTKLRADLSSPEAPCPKAM